MRKIIFTRPDGGLSVVNPVLNTIREVPGFTEADAEQRAWDRLPPDAINPRFVDDADIPTDRSFRNGWKDTGTAVDHDMPKCREIQREKIRSKRAKLFAEADATFAKALEAWLQTQNVPQAITDAMTNRQALRDAPADPAIDAAKTPEELKAAFPAVLSR